jgi:hypothetical protein
MKPKSEKEQTIINANMEIKDRTSDNRKSIKQTRIKRVQGSTVMVYFVN